MIDLHVHFPMQLLGGVEAPRDVVEGMMRVRGREEGKLRAAVLAIAARLFNFRHWDGDVARDAAAARAGRRERRVQRALPAVPRAGPRRAVRRAAGERLLPEADRAARRHRARDRAHRRAHRRAHAPRTSSARGLQASCTASRAASTSARRPTRSPRNVHELAEPRRALHHARAPVLAPRGHQHARAPVPPRRRLQPALPAGRASALIAARRGRRARDVRQPASLVDISHMREDAIEETFKLIEALDRESARSARTR